MSFRIRLVLAFTALALLQAFFFTLLSDQLVRDGLEGEADARLALLGSFFEKESSPPLEGRLSRFASDYALDRVTLMRGDHGIWDSRDGMSGSAPVEDRWLADGLKRPQVRGRAHISGPLFQAEDGWHKTLYYRMQGQDAWLRLEAGTPFLGQVAAIQKRLFRLALALVLPSLALGLGLAFALSRRAQALMRNLRAERGQGLSLPGKDEFASIATSVDGLLKSLKLEREQNEKLLQGRISQARQLAFGVAHELRNPLAGLSLMVELLERKAAELGEAGELAPITSRIHNEAARLEHTVARFLEFARTPLISPVPLDLRRCVDEALRGLAPAPVVMGGASAIADAPACTLIAGILLSNAAESATEQGRVEVRLEGSLLRVWDSGPPVPSADRESLFTPFFTTKPKGMGLGLATAAGLADAMGGRLSLLEDGKTFELRLPAS